MSAKRFSPAPSLCSLPCLAGVLLLATAALTGCNASPESAAVDNFPSLLGTSHFNGEPISTLGANYTPPPDTRQRFRLRDNPGGVQPRSTHHSL